ncbi:4Fe-4S dicluster domain-containing protein [Bacillus sp. 1NLA3E]|uniref:4Fe-4S dicluster domain-containing protein n=1 Tax=Bacillus sp. 1NLA3E TaxID=666686 RepID=UPI000247EFCC|nr:4Fe-4S dicluster domain-containing protein [Bacillus sp. 1NLA3E]AGK55577.1 DMSO reductase, iron-sulfur subunit [Bacillus sp. 1NLA3E]
MAKDQMAFYVDTTKCINCKTCEIACKDINNAALGQRIRKVRSFEVGEYPKIFVYNISMSCNHCEDPQCVKACPAGAYTKREDGIVVHNPDLCIGCRYCTWACPYGAPQFNEEVGKVRKCNMCIDNVKEGELPACVSACPTRAIEIGKLSDFENRPGSTISIHNLPSPGISKPSTRYKVKPEAMKG